MYRAVTVPLLYLRSECHGAKLRIIFYLQVLFFFSFFFSLGLPSPSRFLGWVSLPIENYEVRLKSPRPWRHGVSGKFKILSDAAVLRS